MKNISAQGKAHGILVFASSDRRTIVEVGSEAIHAMLEEASRCFPLETGGLLLGEVYSSGRLLRVTYALGPPRGAEHRPASFWRPEVSPSALEPYLPAHPIGEWHTHPGSSPTPSWRDRMQMAWHARRKTFGGRMPLLVVVGGTPSSTPLWSATLVGKAGQRSTLSTL